MGHVLGHGERRSMATIKRRTHGRSGARRGAHAERQKNGTKNKGRRLTGRGPRWVRRRADGHYFSDMTPLDNLATT
ncbi:hypothetical protein PT2222_40342 [Paraburkholderia tropica]